MNCEQIRSNLLAYLDGEVSDAQRVQIEAHLATCQACAAELERLRALQLGLHDAVPAGLEQLRLPRAAEERIRARLRRERERRGFWEPLTGLLRPRPGLVKVAIPLITILFLIATAFFGTQPIPVSAQETVVIAPSTLAPDTDAALRVIVRDAASTQPISNAEISVRLRPEGAREEVLYTGRTDGEGTADVRFHVPAYERDSLSADLIVATVSAQGRDEITQRVTVRRSYRVYLASDKPLYQPGQAIHLRVLALDTAQGLPAADRQIRFLVQGINGERLYEKTVRASSYGIAAADYALSDSASHGTYRLLATLGDTVSERTVTVGRYERPRFKVDLAPARPYYLPGEVVEGEIAARFFDGSPLPGAAVTLRATLHDPDRREVFTAQGRTDGSGVFSFSFGLPADLRTEQATLALQASVIDESGDTEWAGRVVPVAAESLVVDVVAEGGVLRPGVANTVYILTTTPDGAPVRAQLDVGVAGQGYKLTTDEYGLAQFGLTPDPGVQEVQVQVAASDAEGRMVARTVALSADQGPAQVLLRLDRAAYEVGETMRLEVLAGQGEVVYLDVARRDGGQTLSTHVARLRNGRAELSVDVSPQMAGTLELRAYQVLPDGTLARDARLAVVDASSEVTIDVRPDKTTYRPGDSAHVSIETQLDGKPVQSAVGIAVVDESVFALEERAPGFAKLFFLLEASLRDPEARPVGVALAELLDTTDAEQVRAAQDTAARAAWARLPSGDLRAKRSVASRQKTSGTLWALGLGLGVALLCIPLALWGAVIEWLRRARLPGATLWRTALLWIGAIFCLVIPMVAAVAGLALVLERTLRGALLVAALFAWASTLLILIVDAWRRQDHGAQIAFLLVGAYAVLGASMAYVAERGGDAGVAIAVGVAVTFVPALIALVTLAAGLWLVKRRAAAGLTVGLVLLSVAAIVIAGTMYVASSLFARTITDPRLYAGPVGWLTGCAGQPKTVIVEAEATKVIKETTVTEKEVEKEMTKVVEKQVTATPAVQPTPTAAATHPQVTATPAPLPTASPTPQPTTAPTREPEPPPPLLGQYVPETIYWVPEAITDKSGHLELDIPLPDSPATWRLTALASTRHGQLGAAMATLHVEP